MVKSLPRVAVVGRPNVGKSTLFNRMTGARKAIVDPVAGSTRDRNTSDVSWRGRSFEIVDTGGILEELDTPLDEQVGAQVEIAIGEADAVLWVVDGRAGLLPEEQYLARRLRSMGDRVVLVVNKIDDASRRADAMEFHRLGFSALYEVSAEHGLGVGDLLDAIVERLPETINGADSGEELRVAITGRPNVGKSSLLNRLSGEDRAVVNELAGTTRDAVDTLVEFEGTRYRFVDTAGIRRQGKIPNQADRLGVMYAERAIERAHLCLLVLDATGGVTTEDASIGGKIAGAGRGAVLVFNKWDVVEGREAKAKELAQEARDKMPHLDFAPIVFVSALTGRALPTIFTRVLDVREQQLRRITTSELNRFLATAYSHFPPRARDGKEVNLFYMTQTGVSPPRFVVFANRARKDLDPTYPRYLTRRLRESYGFEGTPLRVSIRQRKQVNSQ